MKLTLYQVLARIRAELEQEPVSLVRQDALRRLDQFARSAAVYSDKKIELKPTLSREAREALKNESERPGSENATASEPDTSRLEE